MTAMETLVVTVRETLENMLGERFTSLPENDRINIQITMIYDLAKRDKNIMGIIGADIYEKLRKA